MDDIISSLTVGQVLTAVAVITTVSILIRKLHYGMKRVSDLLDDWFGEKARPGVSQRKGVMERLSDQDEAISDITLDAEKLEKIDRTTVSHAGHLVRIERLLGQHIRESKHWVRELDSRASERDFQVPPWPSLPQDDSSYGEEGK